MSNPCVLHSWEAEALAMLRRRGLAVKLAVCACGEIRCELALPSCGNGVGAHLYESSSICGECFDAERRRLARADYDASGWEVPL